MLIYMHIHIHKDSAREWDITELDFAIAISLTLNVLFSGMTSNVSKVI
jgi:hypothetical protein